MEVESKFDLHILSDLHLEMRNTVPDPPVVSENIALLGDIGSPKQPHYLDFITRASQRHKRVFVLAGNHEFYNSTTAMDHMQEKITEVCSQFHNVFFLNNSYVDIDVGKDKKYRVAGCTLWTWIPPDSRWMIMHNINDYKRITVNHYGERGRRRMPMTPTESSSFHAESVMFIKRMRVECVEKGRKLIMLTHHAPSFKSCAGEESAAEVKNAHTGDAFDCAYATPLEHLMGEPMVLWAHGHTHLPVKYAVDGTRVYSNPVGYPGEGVPYDPKLVIEV